MKNILIMRSNKQEKLSLPAFSETFFGVCYFSLSVNLFIVFGNGVCVYAERFLIGG